MPLLEIVEVCKGDYGTKFHMINGLADAYNRPVNPDRVREYGKNVMGLAISSLTLIQRDAHTYYIADGQHRVKAISDFANGKPVMMPATIYTVREIAAAGRTVPQFISDLNKGRAFSSADRLAVFQGESPWPEIFDKHGIHPVHKNSRAGAYTWATIIRARLLADAMEDAQKMGTHGARATPSLIEDTWSTYPEDGIEGIETAAKAAVWWRPIAEAARAERAVTSLYSAPALAIAILLYEQNHQAAEKGGRAAEAWETVAAQVVKDPALPALKSLSGGPFMMALLRAVNYKRSVHTLTVFGKDGREE